MQNRVGTAVHEAFGPQQRNRQIVSPRTSCALVPLSGSFSEPMQNYVYALSLRDFFFLF